MFEKGYVMHIPFFWLSIFVFIRKDGKGNRYESWSIRYFHPLFLKKFVEGLHKQCSYIISM